MIDERLLPDDPYLPGDWDRPTPAQRAEQELRRLLDAETLTADEWQRLAALYTFSKEDIR